MQGRKPVPSALRLVTGTTTKRKPTVKNEAKPPPVLLEAPAYLAEDARAEWERCAPALYNCGLLTRIDRPTFEAYCDAYGRFREASRVMDALSASDATTRGIIVTTANGNPILNPVLGQLRTARSDMVRFGLEFGMSPASRTRIDVGTLLGASGSQARNEQNEAESRFFPTT